MIEDTATLLDDPGSELVLALVGAAGANLEEFEHLLIDLLKKHKYEARPIRLSLLLRSIGSKKLGIELKETPEAERLRTYMDAGDNLRKKTNASEALALWAMADIAADRADQGRKKRTAYVLRSLKHPDEARALRATYGPGFCLIGFQASEEQRRLFLIERKGIPEADAKNLIERDSGVQRDYGQQTRKTFELADVFIHDVPENDREGRPSTQDQLGRFLDVLFGHPHVTPTRDEQAMFLAYASSLRSASLSRQVGAVICNPLGDVLAAGCNDVPAPEGGLYWPGDADDARDHQLGHDSNERHKREIANQVAGAFSSDPDMRDKVTKACLESRLIDITEFGRAVHAEMDALMACARSGVSPAGATLYTTTFPCHNCAKHIIAAGIVRLVYIEPYPKSQARDLHDDAIVFPDEFKHGMLNAARQTKARRKRVVFEPFVGVGPRRYFDLFSMKLSDGYVVERKDGDGSAVEWDRSTSVLRVPMLPTSYLEREQQLAALTDKLFGESE